MFLNIILKYGIQLGNIYVGIGRVNGNTVSR